MTGRIFEIREFTLQDGPGVRTTVFFKGCPLRCAWCHNPEGQAFAVETMTKKDGARVTCGKDWTAAELAEELLKNADIMAQSGGGITFSGGEPLAQADFLMELIPLLVSSNPTFRRSNNRFLVIETSGAVDHETYKKAVLQLDFVYQDLKLRDAEKFRFWCGGDLSLVRENIEWLKSSGIPHVFRVPCIPGVNDSPEDEAAFRKMAGDSKIEFLPYNALAGAKYPMLGRVYQMDLRKQEGLYFRNGRNDRRQL